MKLRRWCVAWNGSPFAIAIDSRHFTKMGARFRRMMRATQTYDSRLHVMTIDKAKEWDEEVSRRLSQYGEHLWTKRS